MSTEVEAMILTLETAKQNLLTYGWRRFTYGDHEQGFCLVGAIQEATRTASYELAAQRCIEMQIGMDYNISRPAAAPWNDEQRDKRKVIRLIDRTIKSLKEGKIKV